MKESKKWQDIQTLESFTGGSKRTKTSETTHSQSSDAYVGFDLNEDEPIEVFKSHSSHRKRPNKTKRVKGHKKMDNFVGILSRVRLGDQVIAT